MMAVQLIVTQVEKPWWGLGLIERKTTMVMEATPRATHADIQKAKADLEDEGYRVEVRYP